MSHTYNYPAEVERDEDGRYVVAFPDFGWVQRMVRPGKKRWPKPGICFAS